MSVRGRRYTSIFLTTSLLLSLLSLIVISIMALLQLLMEAESENTYVVLFVFTFVPSAVLSWSSFIGRMLFMNEYADRKESISKLSITLTLAIVLTLFCYFLLLNII